MSWQSKSAAVAIAVMAMSLHSSSVQAMPEQGKVVAGQGEIARPDDKTMVINQKTDRLALDWQKFNIAKDEKVHFDQNSKSAIAINRVVGDGRSIIDGSLSATGNVFVINPNGVLFGKNNSVDVGGLVASTANVTDEDMRNFTQGKGDLGLQIAAGREASVINAGTIKAEGGLVALHATTVENTGTIANEGGTTALAAAKNLNIAADTAGKLNFTVNGSLANAKALNSGMLQSDGGYIVMTAKSAGDVMSTVVNNTGIIEAKTLHTNDKGEILLDGGASGQVEVSGTLNASGMEAGQSAGSIKVIGQKTIINDGTNLLARGTIDGGKIETSGDVLNLGNNLNIDAKGKNGKAGEWLLDPLDVIISDADSDPRNSTNYASVDKNTYDSTGFTNGNLSVGYNDPAATSANATSVNTGVTWITTETIEGMLNAGTSVTIQAAATNGNANILVADNIDKTAGGDATLTLDAMRNITINGHIYSTSNKLNLVLNSDSNGDQIGAVIINADIKTNGGDFTSASGGSVTYTSDKENTKGYNKGTLGTGKADSAGHTVGTYFGHVDPSGTADGTKDDRFIQTNGGKITLNGEVAIGLNGGTLTLDSNGGDVTTTGIINSGNSYGAYVYGTDTWNELTADKVTEYLTSGTVPAYHYQFVNYKKDTNGNYIIENGQYVLDETVAEDGTITYNKQNISGSHYTVDSVDTQNVRFLANGTNSSLQATSVTSSGEGYSSVLVTKGSMTFAQWLQYEFQDAKVEFAKKYIPKSTGFTIKQGTDSKGNATETVVDSSGNAVSDAVLRNYLAQAQQKITKANISNDETVMINGQTAKVNMIDDIERLLASNWFESEQLARYDKDTKTYNEGKSAIGDSYLATITTVLENSLTTPNGQQIMWVGGRGSGVLNKKDDTNNPYGYYGLPDDPDYQNGMYWVTGPEGEANNGKGTQFYSNAGSDWSTVSLGSDGKTYTYNKGSNVYGYVNWDTWKTQAKATNGKTVDVIRSQPDNSSPFLTVGYGTHGKWDDGAMGGATTVGFVKETNLAHSGLNIQAGKGAVNLQGNIGGSGELDTVTINTTGTVTTGGSNATAYSVGTINADHGVTINGGDVTIGGRITTGASTNSANTDTSIVTDSVSITSAGNLTVHGITATGKTDADGNVMHGGNIHLTSTSDTGAITIAGSDNSSRNKYDTYTITYDENNNIIGKTPIKYAADGIENKGTLIAGSSSAGAVIIDAQGQHGSFVNQTRGDADAITTGNKGTWLIYSASPDKDTFGRNLNSGTDAQWTAASRANTVNAAGTTLISYPTDSTTLTTGGKFVFQMTPVITLSSKDYLKIYGDKVSDSTLKGLLQGEESFTGLDGKTHYMTEYTAFKEGAYTDYISNKDSITITSVGNNGVDGASATATRTQGKYAATDKSGADGKNAVYDLVVNTNKSGALNGYALNTKKGNLEIKKRKASITGTGTQTYGDTDGSIKKWTDTKTNIADGSTVTYDTSIKSGSDYTKNQDGRKTADHGTYNDSVSFNSLKITDSKGNDVNIDDNYDLTTTGTIDVAQAKLTVNTEGKITTYGKVDEGYKSSLDKDTQALNGDKEDDLLKELGLTYTLDPKDSAYIDSNGDGKYDKTNHVKYKSDGTYDSYNLDVANTNTLKNYDVTVNDSTVTLERAKATVDTDNVTTTYGKVDKNYISYFDKAVNGDDADKLLQDLNLTYKTDAYKDDTHTNDVKDGGYNLEVAKTANLSDYDVTVKNSNVILNPKTIVIRNTMTQQYGSSEKKFSEATVPADQLANGDTISTKDLKFDIVSGGKYEQSLKENQAEHADAVSADAGTYTGELVHTGGGITHADGTDAYKNYIVTVEGDIVVTPADLTVKINDASTQYGTPFDEESGKKLYDYTVVSGNANGDTTAEVKNLLGQLKDYKNDGVGENGRATKDVGSYGITGKQANKLTNYTVKIENGTATVDPKDVYFHVTGNGKTLGDVVYTVTDPNNPSSPDPINRQLVYGETVTPSYTPDGRLPNGHYGVSTSLPGYGPIDCGKVYGNYRYHYDGDITVNLPSKPDIVPPVNPPVTPGTGTVTPLPEQPTNPSSNTPENTTETTGHKTVWDGDRGGDRPEDKRVVTLPFFKVLEDKTTHRYGTYDVAKRTTEVKIEPSAQVLPEPNQPATQYRELTTELTTDKGTGEFTLKYNGSRFTILPDDDAAMKLIVVGDETKNRALFEKALHVAFTQMGLEVADLDGVYIHFGKDRAHFGCSGKPFSSSFG